MSQVPESVPSDTEELLQQAGRGDSAARSLLLNRHRDQLRRMVAIRMDRRLQARIDPSDVVQDALAEADRTLADFLRRRPMPFYVWLRSIAWQRLVRMNEKHLKAGRRSVLKEAASLCQASENSTALLVDRLALSFEAPDRRILLAELKGRVLTALGQLTAEDRELLVLRYLEQVPFREISQILGCSDGAVRTRHVRALRRLGNIMDQGEGAG